MSWNAPYPPDVTAVELAEVEFPTMPEEYADPEPAPVQAVNVSMPASVEPVNLYVTACLS